MAFFRSLALIAFGAALAFGEDPVAALAHRIEQGSAHLPFEATYGYLPALLDALHIPVESQIAVFSKTSIQSLRIEPSNPRVIYFNDAVSLGWVRGGFLELAAQDPGHGINYYILQQRADERLARRDDCVRCHKSGALQVHSVISSADGIAAAGSEAEIDSRTPFEKLWGGWFITGASVPPGHMGNSVFTKSVKQEIVPELDSKVALKASSDIAALMVFTHQMHMMNLLAHPDNIDELVDYLLFMDESPLPAPLRGDSGFAETFGAGGPRDQLGRSLRELDLKTRLLRYPCSYMIYSKAFDALPSATKESVYRRMSAILSGAAQDARYRRLSKADRQAIVAILRDTKPGLPEWFGR